MYALYLYRRVIFGTLDKASLQAITDLEPREAGFLAVLVLATIWFGVYPKPVFDVTRASTAHLVELHQQGVAVATAEAQP
jgi:NADH-quinone oxidoreductase subunit M